MDDFSRADLVGGQHTTKNGEKDHIVTDLVVIGAGGEILGRSVDPPSSASETLETVESRHGINSNLGWNLEFRSDPLVGENRIYPQLRNCG